MRSLKFIYVIILGVMFSSCGVRYYKKMSHLSEEDLEWINCYNVGDTVLFQSDSGKVNTLYVINKNINNLRCPFYLHLYDPVGNGPDDIYRAYAKYRFYIKGAENTYIGSFGIDKSIENDNIGWWSMLNERYSKEWPSSLDMYDSENQTIVKDIEYNGIILSDCIVCDDTNTETDKKSVNAPDNPDNYIDSYIISKKYGLISYKLKNGETFTRVRGGSLID